MYQINIKDRILQSGTLYGTLADCVRIYSRASFWSWLNPGPAARLWMLVFVLGGISLASRWDSLMVRLARPPASGFAAEGALR